MTKIVVVGGDAAGASAASQIKRRQPDYDVVVIERGQYTSYAACGLPYWVSGAIPTREALIARSAAKHRANGLDVRLDTEVIGLDPQRAVVRVVADGVESDESYDQLIIATGASPFQPAIPGADAPNVAVIHSIPGTEYLMDRLSADQPRTAVVVGAGYIGIEMVEALRDRGLSVTVIDAAPGPMVSLDPDMSALVAAEFANLGVTGVFGQAIAGIETNSNGVATAVTTDSGERFPADIVILALGVRPNAGFAAAAGLPVGRSGGLLTDRRQAVVGHANIWAAGDVVETYHRLLRTTMHVPLGTHANKQGRVVGVNVAGGYLTFPGIIGTAITRVGAAHIARTGLTEAQAAAAGFATVSARVATPVLAHYMPDHGTMHTKVLAERGTGRLLGGQIIGDHVGAAKRIDTLAAAIWSGWTAEDLTSMDLAYAPPFSPVWDPVQVAARRAADLAQSTNSAR